MKGYLLFLVAVFLLSGCGRLNELSNTIRTQDFYGDEGTNDSFVEKSLAPFVDSPDENIGNKVLFTAEIIQVLPPEKEEENIEYLAIVSSELDEETAVCLTIEMNRLEYEPAKEDKIKVWAVSKGAVGFDTATGDAIVLPSFYIDKYVLQD